MVLCRSGVQLFVLIVVHTWLVSKCLFGYITRCAERVVGREATVLIMRRSRRVDILERARCGERERLRMFLTIIPLPKVIGPGIVLCISHA